MFNEEQLALLRLSFVPKLALHEVHQWRLEKSLSWAELSHPNAWPEGYLSSETTVALSADPPSYYDAALRWVGDNKRLVFFGDADYPASLTELADAPLVLYTIGDPAVLSRDQIAIVGSRSPSIGGKDNATAFAAELASAGLVITSGLALGIDASAHQGAINGNGQTVAVIGTGADRVYPAQNQALAHQIAANGCIISEFALGAKPLNWHFPRRNRLIAALSKATLVIEAALSSGSLITAKEATDLGREVMAIPGSIHNPLSRGPHQLIRQGAKLVETAADVLEELQLQGTTTVQRTSAAAVDPDHQTLLEAMGFDPVTPDQLVERSGFKAEAVASMLLILELRGVVDSVLGAYQRRR